jgi:alkylation response protein AidB-like acyl-CoA dehydrogenase
MDFNLTSEQQLFQESVRRFAESELKPDAVARAHSSDYPWEVAKKLARQGLMGITIPTEKGGQGGSLLDAVLAIEQIALADPRSADVIQAGNFGAVRVLAEFGTEDQLKRYLGSVLSGEKVMSVAMTEPDAGSAATELKTRAEPDGDGYRVSGSKIFTTHGMHAHLFLVYVRFGPGLDGIGSVLIERGSEGLEVGKGSKFLSGEEWTTFFFDRLYVPKENVLLGPGGFKKQISAFNIERLGNSARALALGEYAFRGARDYALFRHQFGRPLCEFQGLQWKFANMRMQLEAARLLLYRAASNADRGLPSAADTAMAKAFCNRAGFDCANESMQVMGGMGYSQETLVEYCFRRTRGWMIAGGSIEMMLNRIAEDVFGRHFPQRRSSATPNPGT